MGTFTCEPAQDQPRLREDLEHRMRRECQSVQANYLVGQNCYWQLRQQEDEQRPYFARAIDKEHNALLYTLCFDPNGHLTPNRLPHETSFPVTLREPFARLKDVYIKTGEETVAAHGLTALDIDLYRRGWSAVRGDNPLCLAITVSELPSSVDYVKEQVANQCRVAAERNSITNVPNIQIILEQKATSNGHTASPDLPLTHTSEDLQGPTDQVEMATGAAAPGNPPRTTARSDKGTPPVSPARQNSFNAMAASRTSSTPKKVQSPKQASSTRAPQPQPPTATSVATEFFQRDFATHANHSESAKFAVILHDSCYGHRFSRPRTSKANLSTIVERPERILAITLGVAASYVLLGGRYAGAQNPPHPANAPQDVPFIIRKSNRFVPITSPAVTNVHGTKWMNELRIMCDGAETKLATNGKELVRPADGEPDKPQFHEGDLYLCAESLDAFEGALGAVLDAVDLVFDVNGPKSAFVGIRPPGHHCSADYPAGFCWLNNVHVGISHAAAVHGLTHAAIIDFDLHHGDGSQAITWAHNARVASLPKNASFSKRTSIGYFSLHDINSYPCEWGDDDKVQAASLCIENAHGQTVWNTHLQTWKTNEEFWKLYRERYAVLVEKARDYLRRQTDRLRSSVNAPQPRGVIFISAGFDASEWEGQGMQRHKVNVPTDFYERFTQDVMAMSHEPGLGVDGRVVSVLEGGYSDRALTSGVMSHLSGMISSATMSDHKNHELASQMDNLSLEQGSSSRGLDNQAWSPGALEELEAAVKPATSAAPKKPRGPINPTYSTPTQSSSAKVHPAVAARRSSAFTSEPVPQPGIDDVAPDIGWAIAAHALSKVLVPDRQTRSCRPEDLNAEATRLRRERQSAIGAVPPTPVAAPDAQRMQLRGRKAKAQNEDDAARASRRTTIEGSEIADLVTADATPRPITAPRRRMSVASTVLSTTEEAPEVPPPPPQLRRSRRSSSIAAREASAAAATRSSTTSSSRPASSAAKGSRPGSRTGSPTKARARKPAASKVASKAPAARTAQVHDVDELEVGMKKMSIKLNLGPKPEPNGEPKKKASRASRKPTARSEAKASTPVSAVSTQSMDFPSASGPSQPGSELPTPIESIEGPDLFGGGRSEPPPAASDSRAADRDSMQSPQESGQLSETANATSLNYSTTDEPSDEVQSAAGPAISAAPPAASMLWQPPTTKQDPRTPEHPRHRLPVFTANSPIPFGPVRPVEPGASEAREPVNGSNPGGPQPTGPTSPSKLGQ